MSVARVPLVSLESGNGDCSIASIRADLVLEDRVLTNPTRQQWLSVIQFQSCLCYPSPHAQVALDGIQARRCGGTGRHRGLKIPRLKRPFGFKSRQRHQSLATQPAAFRSISASVDQFGSVVSPSTVHYAEAQPATIEECIELRDILKSNLQTGTITGKVWTLQIAIEKTFESVWTKYPSRIPLSLHAACTFPQ